VIGKARAANNSDPYFRVWLERYPLLAFFILTYLISWSVWFSQPLLNQFDPVSGKSFGLIAAYGPSLAAVLNSAMLRPKRVPAISLTSRWVFPVLALLASLWVTWDGFTRIPSSHAPVLAATLWVLVNLLPAWMFWMVGSRIQGVRELLQTLTTWRVKFVWWLAALGLLGSSYLVAYAILTMFGQAIPAFPRTENFSQLLRLVPLVFLGTFLYGGPLGEESGWRGFALPRLQERFDPLFSSVILGTLWGVWHFPLHVQGFYDKLAVFTPNLAFALLMRVGSGIALAIVFTWLYNRTRGNVLLMVVLHTATNLSTGWLVPVGAGVYLGTILLAVALAIVDRMWQKQSSSLKVE
jgi:membrane protease YdiL (CAAX protease family)